MSKKILIIQLRPGLGDLCMFLPRCHEVAKANPNHEIYLLTKENTKADQLLKYDPYVKNIFFIDKDKKKISFYTLYKFFKINKFKKVYSYQYGPKYLKYILLSKLTFVKELYYYGIFKKKEDMVKKSISANQLWLNINIEKFEGNLFLEKRTERSNKRIIIGLGASGDNKRWPIENYLELIQKLNHLSQFDFILAGGPGEKELINQITKLDIKGNFISLEKLNVEESVKEIDGSYFFIGNDTGFMHVSACLGIKTFCIYGDTPSEDSKYNKNIYPILPPGVKETYHKDLAMNKINTNYVYELILKELITITNF